MSEYTERGFRVYDAITARAGDEINVIQSSLASERCVWLQVTEDDTRAHTSVQLTVEQAHRLAMALMEFVEDRDG